MIQYNLASYSGFQVIHNSTEWRTAIHSYKKEINGIEALKDWGIHVDSEEAFVLLSGEAILAIKDDKEQVRIIKMNSLKKYVVAMAERHAIVLKENAKVLIMENRDMSKFETEAIDEKTYAAINAAT